MSFAFDPPPKSVPSPDPVPASAEPCPICCECCMGGNTDDCSGSGHLTAEFPDSYCVYFHPYRVLRLWHRLMPNPVAGGEPVRPVECGYVPRDESATEVLYGPPAVLARRYVGCAPGPHYPGWHPVRIHRVKPTRWEGQGVVGGVPVCVRMVCTGAAGDPMLRVYGPGWTGVMLDKMWLVDPNAWPPSGPVPPPARRVLSFQPHRPFTPLVEQWAYAVPLGHSRSEHGATHEGCEVLEPRRCSRWWAEPPPCLEVEVGDLLTPVEMAAVFGDPRCAFPESSSLGYYHAGVRACDPLSRAFGGVTCRAVLGAEPGADCGTTAALRTGEGAWYGEFTTASGAVYGLTVTAPGGVTRHVPLGFGGCDTATIWRRAGRFRVGIRHLHGGRVPGVNACCLVGPAAEGDTFGGSLGDQPNPSGATAEGAEANATAGQVEPLPDCEADQWDGVLVSKSFDCNLGGNRSHAIHGRRLTVRVCGSVMVGGQGQLSAPPPAVEPVAGQSPAEAGDCLSCGQQVIAAMEAAHLATGPERIPLLRCHHLGGRKEFRAGCLSGFGCRHACRNDRPDVAAHLAPHPGETTPSEDCGPDCPGYAASPLAWDWRTPTSIDPTE